MKTTMSAVLLSSVMIFSGSVFADTMQFAKSVVDGYKMGATTVKGTVTMADGKKHEGKVQLQDNVMLKDLTSGNLVYCKDHAEVLQVTNATMGDDGSLTIDMKSTNLFIGKHKENKDTSAKS